VCKGRDLNMQILSLHFSMYTVGGIWRPVEWSSDGAKLLYSIFTFIIVSSEYFLMITQFMDIVLVVDNIDDFTANTLMFLTIVAVCCKATVVVVRRNAIINIVQLLLKAPHKPRNEDEVAIQTKFDKFIRTFTLRYTFLATGSITGLTLGSILNAMHGHLPYRVWLPWNYDIPLVFWIISIHQILTLLFACIINVGTETLVLGLLIQTCAQLEIFESRLHKFIINKTVKDLGHTLSTSNKNEVGISECVHYHLSIYKFAKTVNVIFNQVLFVQFFSSIIVLCTCVYYLSTHTAELSGLVSFLVYTICMFAQIFVYCWSGNEVILKSTSIGDTIYRTDWPLLSIREKKGLLMIMMRSTIPIKFTSSFLITLSLQSYSNVIFVVKNLADLISCCYVSLDLIGLLSKASTIVIYRDRIINLIKILQEKPCKACDKEEIDIQMKFDRLIRSYSMPYIIVCSMSAICCAIRGTLYVLEGQIPFGYFVWVPWDCTSFLILFLTSVQLIVSLIIAIIVILASDTVVFGFCLQTCAQFEILKHRLQKMIKFSHNEKKEEDTLTSSLNISNKTSRLAEHVSHHLCIIRLAEMINDVFSQVIFVQFSKSVLVLCTLVYSVPRMTVTDIATLASYIICMFMEIFYYCWAGNEVTLKSAGFGDKIYNMDWVLMTNSEQKDLLMIMKRSTKPIKLSSSFLVTLSLESYSNLMKTSFSVFNIMQQF
ncbi:odorant receptor 2a-like, partial [Temnothorax curvispinosus]|uniref:Odorant receptor 2a-like n=1 Tax=Temnothorax curvispinosus TaxID=300111 RepID=A0A6J1QX32_9HYME